MVDKRENDKSRDKDALQDFSEIIKKMLDSLGIDPKELSGEPFVCGFSITNLSGESPEISEFGNFSPDFDMGDDFVPDIQSNVGDCKPLIDILETEDQIYITAELHNVEKEEIQLSVSSEFIDLNTYEEGVLSETLILPAKVDPSSAKASYRNGVLEIILTKEGDIHMFDVSID
ncbi:HSP20 family protein [Methanohalophilus levihalophilus]|uniref:Hsp20/alpha crystallin family protein n=1 Tax=Methanohalophilus levihalophilus TaxID=1431282 RepID=UPI001AE57FCB|nr:Hsp20/alpha crystallin family protein [Methanohalophilus levihalophilus]MBP2029213.1 HSP20 family protein [Methanohalophilus levihalophilus]